MEKLFVNIPIAAPAGDKPWDVDVWCKANCKGANDSAVDVDAHRNVYHCIFYFAKPDDVASFRGKWGKYVS